MTYVVEYKYEFWQLGCDCCSDSRSVVTISKDSKFIDSFDVDLMEDEDELREFMDKYHPEYKGFIVDPDSEWF